MLITSTACRTFLEAKKAFVNLGNEEDEEGLQVNKRKSNIMDQTQKEGPAKGSITIHDYNLKNVDRPIIASYVHRTGDWRIPFQVRKPKNNGWTQPTVTALQY